MTVKVSRPSIDIRGMLDELNKPSGIAGNAMLAAETPQEQFNLIGAGRKNLIINGGFQVSQRGDYKSGAVAAVNNAYCIDRWNTWLVSVTATQQLQTATINGVLKNTFKITSTGTAAGAIGFAQRIETQDFPIGGNITVSCWMKSNNAFARLRQNNVANTDSNSITHSGGGNWEFMSWTLDTTGTAPNHSSINFGAICYDAGNVAINTGDYIEVADFQLEIGSVATPFEHRSYGEELALCQRFYQKVGNGSAYTAFGIFNAETTGAATCAYVYSQEMRAAPSVSKGGAWQFFTGGITSSLNTFNGFNATKTTCRLEAAPFAALTVGRSYILRCENDANAFIAFDAEL